MARDEDASAIGFDEGPKPRGWIRELEERGILVVRDVLREEARDVLRGYAESGGEIYNSRSAAPPEDARRGFVCPECGSEAVGLVAEASTVHDPKDPWSSVLQRLTCAECEREIPAHLGERWNGISAEDAREQWRDVYRSR